jgi:chemotaxis protein MotB
VKELPPKPRVIVKQGHAGAHRGGAWKVAYADFVTTMMALFIVLWIVGQNAGTREAVAKYFKDPGVPITDTASSLLPGSAGILPGHMLVDGAAAAREDTALQAAGERFKDALEARGLVELLRKQVRVEVTSDGLRIELRERDHAPFFRLGSASVLPEMQPILEQVARAVAPLPNPITIEGHTDSRQYASRDDYSNWELSTDRTNSARRIMEAAGLPAGRIDRLVGHADRLPAIPGDPENASNRRITIVVRRQVARRGAPPPSRTSPQERMAPAQPALEHVTSARIPMSSQASGTEAGEAGPDLPPRPIAVARPPLDRRAVAGREAHPLIR